MNYLNVVIVTWNSENYICACLKSLKLQKDIILNLIIVDNGSNDNTISKINKIYPNAKIIINKKNKGFVAANQAIPYLKYPYTLFLNVDTYIKDKYLLSNTISLFRKNSKLKVIGIPSINPDKSKTTIFKFHNLKNYFSNRISLEIKENNIITFGDWVSGCCMFMETDIFKKVGGFYKKYFAYYEDEDFCFQVKKLGYMIGLYNESEIYHLHSSVKNQLVNDQKIYNLYARNKLLFLYRFYDKKWIFIITFLFDFIKAWYHLFNWLILMDKHNLKVIKGLFNAYFHFNRAIEI